MPRKKVFESVTEYKNAYTAEKYDRISLFVAKGKKDKIKAHAKSKGKDSINSYINDLIDQDLNSN